MDDAVRTDAFCRIASGAYSGGRSQGMASKPMPKNMSNRDIHTIATIPQFDPHAPVEAATVPARTAMQQPCPVTAKCIRIRRPILSMIQIGINDDNQNAMPKKPERRPERCCVRPTDS